MEGGSSEGLPNKEYCPDCLNTNELPGGICGRPASGPSYTEYLDSTGIPMPWISQETYIEGEEITVKHFYTTHHYGHITLSACPLGKDSTQECFDNPANWLEFVRDESYGMPKDINHPERAYLKRGPMDFTSVFKLPNNVIGEEVLIQWRYITANSCLPDGYTEYFNWAISDPNYDVQMTDWKGANMQACDKYPQDGSKPDGGAPEQFWNCAEVTILSGTPTPPTPATPSPTRRPSTPAPINVVPNPSGIPFPCCSWYSDFCDQPHNTWCHESESNCNTCTGVWRDPYNQPQPTPTASNPTVAPPTVAPPTDIPTTGIPCCSINLKDCMSWCESCHNSKEACESEGNTFWMPWGEPVDQDSCIAITYSCVGHGKPCCPGMICNPDTSSAPCIVDQSPPVTSPPQAAPTNPPIPLTSPPSAAPTSPPNPAEGCYSMNHKDCLPDGYPADGSTCGVTWLPNGERTGCVALGGDCGPSNSCCGDDLECFGSGGSASCLPPLFSEPTASPAPCAEDDDDLFLLKMKDDTAVTKTCEWLQGKPPEKKANICSKTHSSGEYQPASVVCPITCELCTEN